MKYNKFNNLRISLVLILSLIYSLSFTQVQDTGLTKLDIGLVAGYAGPKAVPFWMRSNQYGSIPLEGASASMLLRAAKIYDPSKNTVASNYKSPKWDWGYSFEGRANVGNTTQVKLIEANVKVRWSVLEAKLGRSKDVMGLNGDTLLSSGNFAVSGNALGIPVLDLRLADYYRIPVFGGLFSFKGNLANGYIGKMNVVSGEYGNFINGGEIQMMYHQKSLYGRFGRKSWRLNLFGGINHQVQWGGENIVYGKNYLLNKTQTMWYVFLGLPYGAKGVPKSKLGNQIGSVDLGFSYDWDHVKLMGYRQNFYDVGAISRLANIADGLNGISLLNKEFEKSNKTWNWKSVLVEFFYSKDQAGYPWSKPTKSGDENYYNNGYPYEGWSYKGLGLGSPLITTAHSVKPIHANNPKEYFSSNRVMAGHFGISGEGLGWQFYSKFTVAKHYGTFSTSEFGGSRGNIHHTPYKDQFEKVKQISAFIHVQKTLNESMFLGISMATDFGKLFYNSSGLQVTFKKSFLRK